MGKRTGSLMFGFGVMFSLFTTVMLVIGGFTMYYNQSRAYKQEREESLRQVASYLADVLMADGEEFAWYQDYFLAHADTLLVPYDFSLPEVLSSRARFEERLAREHPGRVLGRDLRFEELSEEAKALFTVSRHERFLYRFEQARDKFGLKYVEYVVPNAETLDVTYTLDALRDERVVDGGKYVELAITVKHPVAEHLTEWEAWNTGVAPGGLDVFDNEYGRTYAFYLPLHIGGRKLGLVGVEVEIAAVNEAILRNTLTEIGGIAAVLVACVVLLLLFIYRRYISKLERLQRSVGDYTLRKDVAVAGEIERAATGGDEISSLAREFSSMVLELENYMTALVAATNELKDSREKAAALGELAVRDALTGIRNKSAYDKEVARLEWSIGDGSARFGIAMVDLNFLKRINDTYGHEQGNLAIRRLCFIVCHVFEHSPVFRIGGDEFVVVLENGDYDDVESLVAEFNARLAGIASEEGIEPWERVSAAIGFARFDPDVDGSVANVFRRADKAMYARKKEMKAVRES